MLLLSTLLPTIEFDGISACRLGCIGKRQLPLHRSGESGCMNVVALLTQPNIVVYLCWVEFVGISTLSDHLVSLIV